MILEVVLHWTKAAKEIWPDATFVLFDAFAEAEFLYEGYQYHMGVLSDEEKEVDFYQNEYQPGGNSYYREIGSLTPDYHFPKNLYIGQGSQRARVPVTRFYQNRRTGM